MPLEAGSFPLLSSGGLPGYSGADIRMDLVYPGTGSAAVDRGSPPLLEPLQK